jgi:hypothetical protein
MAEALILPLFGILYNLDIWEQLPSLALVAFLGTVGFSAIGTLLAAMTAHLRAREVMLPLLLFPLTVPVILGSVRATEAIRGDCVYLVHGFGHTSKMLPRALGRGASDAELITRYQIDPLMGGTGMNVNFVTLEVEA